ncbi:MAG: 2-C-methyl-D-erythritol 2,4-cyclodiphosphate synthase [Gammaproteobacteria bacterium]
MRIGHGYDAHKLVAGRSLILGGVTIPHAQGLAAHSDGDAVIHAVCDALLGAAALGDMGSYFPDTDMAFKDIDSRLLLRRVTSLLNEQLYTVCNTDITIMAQAPKMSPYITDMRANLAQDMGINVSAINIKATTTEGMGFIGREEGIAVHAVILIMPGDNSR